MIRRALVCATLTLACAPSGGYAADSITLSPRVAMVGKWAEGMTYGGGSLWVAESGQRSIAQLNLDNTVARRITVGRLPVQMTFANDGAVYTLVQTDKLLWQQQPRQAQGRAITGLPGCPNNLVAGDRYLWVLTWPDCTSNSGRVIRIDPRSGNRTPSATLAEYAQGMIADKGKVWITHDRGQALSIVDEQSLAIRKVDVPNASLLPITTTGGNVYAGGGTSLTGTQGLVVSLNPATAQEVKRQTVDQLITVMTNDEKSVVAIGDKGKIFVFAADTLELQRTITVPGRVDPRAAMIMGDDLYITSGQHQGENGAVLTLSGWRPVLAPPTPPTPPRGGAGTGDACPYQVVNVSVGGVIWMHEDPDPDAPKVVAIPGDAKGLIADRCIRDWCHVTYRGAKGWVQKSNIQSPCG